MDEKSLAKRVLELEKENTLLRIEIANKDSLICSYQNALDELQKYKRYQLEVKYGIRKIKEETPGLDEKIIKLKREGRYIKDIAEECGVAQMTIYRHLRKMRELGIKI